MGGGFSEAARDLAGQPALQGALAALGTFVLEDPTTVACGLLVADGRMAFVTAMVGVSAGIALGDLGLYGVGRAAGPAAARRGWLSGARMERARLWFRRDLVLAVVLSRFVPGMRLPTYVAAGAFGVPWLRFLAVSVVASVVWTFLLLRLTVELGETMLPWLGRLRWPAAAVALALLVLAQRRMARAVERDTAPRAAPRRPVASRFEFWPPWLFYPPVAVWYALLALRHRGLTLPTAANPSIYSGGVIGESKSAILELVSGEGRRWIAPWIVLRAPGGERHGHDAAVGRALVAMRRAGLRFPVVAKPDVGQRGDGVRPLAGREELATYLAAFPPGRRLMLQAAAGCGPGPDPRELPPRLAGVREAGVLYWRRPRAPRGCIPSITLKRAPEVVGDGRRTLAELIDADPRARRIRRTYRRRHAAALQRVPAPGEAVPLVFSGNHCQGAVFEDGTDLLTPELERRVHEIAAAIPEFWFGRFDVRFDDPRAWLRGEGFHIVEINGASAEATHIWDAAMPLGRAYRTLFRQFSVLFEIAAANRRRGHRPLGLVQVLREVAGYRRLSRGYPPAA